MKQLFFDIENSPKLIWAWDLYETNALKVEEQSKLISFSYKWKGERRVKVHSLKNNSTKGLLLRLHALLDEADIVIGHNSKQFDTKMINAFFAHEGLKPPSPYKQIDTLQIARSKFKFASNHLNDLGEYLGCGKKVKTGGIDLWFRCMSGDKKAWKLMETYNARDTELLEKVYEKLIPWAENTPKPELGMTCPACGGTKLQRRGWNINQVFMSQRLFCTQCGRWCQSSNKIKHNKLAYTR